MEAEEVQVPNANVREQGRHQLRVHAELLGPAARGIRSLTWKSRFTRTATRGRMPRRSPMARTRSASVADSISIVTPAATAWLNSSGVLPGPAKLTRSPAFPCRGRCASPPRRPRRRRRRVPLVRHHGRHGVGLDHAWRPWPPRRGRPQQHRALCQRGPVVGEERRPAHARPDGRATPAQLQVGRPASTVTPG